MRKILVINQAHTPNIGDIAINNVIGAYLQQKGYAVLNAPFWESNGLFFKSTNRLTRNVARLLTSCQPIVDGKNRKRIIRQLIPYEAAKGAVIGGGELLSRHKGFNSSFFCWVDELHKRQIPIYVIGVSGDDSMHNRYKERYADALKKCTYVCVRDRHTADILQQKYNISAYYAPDVVFAYRYLFDDDVVPQRSNSLVCIPVSYSKAMQDSLELATDMEYYGYLLGLIRKNSDPSTEIILANTTQTDIPVLNSLQQYLSHEAGITPRVALCKTVEELTTLLGGAGVVVSARMHAMILALQYGAQVVPIIFKDKLKAFSQEVLAEEFDRRKMEREAIKGLDALVDRLDETI